MNIPRIPKNTYKLRAIKNVSDDAWEQLKHLSTTTGASMGEVLSHIILKTKPKGVKSEAKNIN